jgi:hypothetical protein
MEKRKKQATKKGRKLATTLLRSILFRAKARRVVVSHDRSWTSYHCPWSMGTIRGSTTCWWREGCDLMLLREEDEEGRSRHRGTRNNPMVLPGRWIDDAT